MKIRTGFVTNSSSSCFVVQTGEGVEEVREALQALLDFHTKFLRQGDLSSFDSVFMEPFVYERRMIPRDRGWRWNYECEDSVGKVVILSADDNSIPWGMCDMISQRFETWREHLG